MVQGRAGVTGGPPVPRKRGNSGLVPHRDGGNAGPELGASQVREMAADFPGNRKATESGLQEFHGNEGRTAKRPSGLRLFRPSVGRPIPPGRPHRGTGCRSRRFF